MVGRGGRVKLTEVNPHLVCVLCRGYLIDATTITECLHSFCRSCIILYLETKSYCPICEVQIHKTKPYLNLKLDKTLQDIVYKLVPGLFHSEMRRRQEFYKNHPVHDLHLHPEARGLAIDRLIYSPDDSISLSLEYYDSEREREEWTSVAADACEHASKRASSRTNIPPALTSGASTDAQIAAGSKHEQDQIQVEQNKKRYLLCPAVVTMVHLKKFVRNKYNLPDTSNVEIIYRRESLPDSYSLMDVAYIYTWKQNEPMKFYYRIHLLKTVQSIPDEESLIDSKSLKSATVPQRSSNDRSEKREKLKVNGSSKSIKHEAIDIKKKEPVKIESPIRASKINEAYSLDDEIDVVKESRSAVPNRVKPKPPAISTQRNGSIPIPSNDATNKSNADSPKIESKQQESQNIKSKFYQDPSRNILPYKSKARSTVPSEHFPTKPYKRQRVTNSKNKLSHGSPNTSKTSPKSVNTVESKRTGISPSKNVSIKINIANATLAETNNSVTSTICENTMENGHSASNSLKRTNELAVENRLCTTNSNKTDHELSKSNVTIEKHLLSEALSQVARSELKSIINDQGTKFPVNSSPSSELDPINVTNNQFFSESKQLSNKSQDLSNKSVQKQVTPLKIVVQQKQSPDKNGNKTNGLNESNKSEAQKTQDTGIKSNISEDIKRSISLDKAAEELLSAVGLKPKHDLKEAFKSMNDIKEESSKENVSPEQQKNDKKETSEFSLTGLGIQRPFRSEHDEMSVNLLLSFSNGHTSNNHNLTTADQTIPEKHLPKNPSESNKAPIDQKNNLIESSNTNVTLSNKNLMIEPTTPVVGENSQDKGRSENFSSISTPINGFTVSVNNVNNKNETNITNSHKSNAIESELKISKSEVEKSNEKNEQHQSKSNPSGNTKILSYSKQKKIPEENVGLENNQIILNKINTGMQQEDKCSKSPVMTPQVTKHQNRTTKDISKTVDFLLMKSLSVSKETIATKVITSGTSQIDVLTSLRTPKMNGKCDVVSPTSSRRENNQNEATAKSIAALALTSLTGQREVTNSGIASPRRPWADGEEEEDVQNSKVRMLKRKLNRPGDCGVHVSTATRDDGLSEAKRRKLVTPDVSIELLTHPINERTANKRPLVDNKKPCPEKKPKMNIVESVNQDELIISSVEHLAASTVKIEKVAQGHLKFSALSPTLSVKENSAVEMPSGKSSPDHLRPITPKNLAGDRCGTPDITIEKMSDKKLNVSPNALSQHKRNSTSNSSNEVFAKTGVKAGIQTSCSPTVVKSDTKAKSGLGSPTTSNAEPSTSPVGQKKMPKLIEINAPARSKIEVMTADKKPTNNQNQRTGLKMTTVRKEVPIGKQMTFVKKDSNGALDLSPASVPKSRPALPPRIQQTFPSGSVDMYPAAALHLLQMQMQSRLLASQANNNMTQRKDPELSKQLKDWVRNAVNCGALPPHPLMFGPLPQQQSQQQSPPQRSNANLSSTP